MKNVILYFPFLIGLRAFILSEKLDHITVDPSDPFLKVMLNEAQIDRACSTYGARIV